MLRRVCCMMMATVLPAVLGCNAKTRPQNPKTRYRGVTIRLVVPDRPELVTWLNDQRGEWSAQTGAQVELVRADESTESSDGADNAGGSALRTPGPPGDILIYRTSEMGSVASPGAVVKLPKEVLDSSAFEVRDLGPAVLDQLIAWDRQPHAVPISAEAMLVYYRPDLLAGDDARNRFEQKFGHTLRPPATWTEFDEIAEFFDGQDLDGDGSADHSVAVSSAGEALVCRAATYGKVPQNLSFYFDVHTLEPLVAGPAFRQAMEEWRGIARCVAGAALDRTLETLAAGRAVLGIGSSALAARLLASGAELPDRDRISTRTSVTIGCAPLPGSSRAFQHDKQNWINLPADKPNRTAVVQGVVASVLEPCSNRGAAFDLLTFLTSRERSLVPVTTPANRLGPFRMSHLVDPLAWTSAGWSNTGTPSYVAAMRDSLSEPNAVATLRILGADEFAGALDAHAAAVLRGETTPEGGLKLAADEWNAIAERLGKARLRWQYSYSLGMPIAN